MTTKPKTRKAPAAKAAAPKPAPKAPAAETKEQASEIRRLISRWKWLEADETYQADISTTDEECDRVCCLHEREKKEILRKLVDKAPDTFFDSLNLLDHATWLIDQSDAHDDDIIALLKNVRTGLFCARSTETKSARKEGMEKMRSHYAMMLDVSKSVLTTEMVDKLCHA